MAAFLLNYIQLFIILVFQSSAKALAKMKKNKNKNKNDYPIKDSAFRSIVKAISWRFIASLTTFLVTFIIFKSYTGKTYQEAFETATFVAAIEVFAKLLFYYLHERLWVNIQWGKDSRRDYFQRKAWRKIYRKKH
jgi:uncharacterized membrane protein